jgi:hypothetical protein
MENKWDKHKNLADRMTEYANNYKCKKCKNEFCEHLVEDRYNFFKEELKIALSEIAKS